MGGFRISSCSLCSSVIAEHSLPRSATGTPWLWAQQRAASCLQEGISKTESSQSPRSTQHSPISTGLSLGDHLQHPPFTLFPPLNSSSPHQIPPPRCRGALGGLSPEPVGGSCPGGRQLRGLGEATRPGPLRPVPARRRAAAAAAEPGEAPGRGRGRPRREREQRGRRRLGGGPGRAGGSRGSLGCREGLRGARSLLLTGSEVSLRNAQRPRGESPGGQGRGSGAAIVPSPQPPALGRGPRRVGGEVRPGSGQLFQKLINKLIKTGRHRGERS